MRHLVRLTHGYLTVLIILTGLFLWGCGGDSQSDAQQGAQTFVSMMSAEVSPMSSSANTTVTANMTMDWAERTFPELFPRETAVLFPVIEYEGVTYNARAYVGAWGDRYLGITQDGRIFGLGDFTEYELHQFETISFWADQILASPSDSGSLQTDQWWHRTVSVPAGTSQLKVYLTVPRGTVELLLKHGQQPDEQMYDADGEDCYDWADPVFDGQCVIDAPAPGTWHIALWAVSDSDYTLQTALISNGGEQPGSDEEPAGEPSIFNVGTAGGTLDVGDLIVQIGAGALKSTETVSITPMTSGAFRVAGLPAELHAPVRFRFPTNVALNAIVRVVADDNCYSPSLGKRVDCNDMLPGEYEDGYISAVLPANSEGQTSQAFMQMAATPTDVDRSISLLTDYTSVTSPLGYYRLVVKNADYDQAKTEHIFAAMQASDERFYENGMDMSKVGIPYSIYVFDTTECADVSGNAGYMLSEYENRFISATILNKETYHTGGEFLATTVGHEYFHAQQVAHMPTLTRYQSVITDYADPLRVLMEASSTWFERLLSNSGAVPPNEIYFNSFPFYGLTADMTTGSDFMQPPTNTVTRADQIGYGMGTFMHFLTLQSQSFGTIFRIWDAIASGNELLAALESTVRTELRDDLANVWSQFARLHFSGGMESLAGWPHAPESYAHRLGAGNLHTAFDLARYAAISILFENDKNESSTQKVNLSTNGDVELLFLDGTGTFVTLVTDGTQVTIPSGTTWKLIVVSKTQNAYVNIQVDELDDNLQGRFIPQGQWTWGVLDTHTNLMWDMNTIAHAFQSWSDAEQFCNSYQEGGHTNWRLPTIEEVEGFYAAKGDWLETMLIRHRYSWVWTSNTRIGEEGSEALTFRFGDGASYWVPPERQDVGRPMCVRVP